MASMLHSDVPLECFTHCCTALQVQDILTRAPRERLQTHGHIAVARSMEFNKDPLGVMGVLLEQPEIQVNVPEFGGEVGNTLLHLAVSMHNEDEKHEEDENDEKHEGPVSLILKRPDLDPNLGNSKGDTPLHSAARASSVPCLDILLDYPRVNVGAVNYNKQTCLHVACEASSTRTSDRIARKIIDSARSTVRSFPQFLRKQDQFGNTGLHYAAARDLENVVDSIFEAENLGGKHELAVKQNHHGNLAIHLAARKGHCGVVDRMLVLVDDSHVEKVVVKIKDQDGFGLLHHAVLSGRQELLQLCIDRLPKPTRPTFGLYMELLAVAPNKNVANFLLLRLSLEDEIVNSSKREGDYLASLLHFAVSEKREEKCEEKREALVKLIVKWHPNLAVVAMHEALEMPNETVQAVLRDHPNVQREFVKMHKKYTYYVTAANAILVVAMLMVALTYSRCLTSLETAKHLKDISEVKKYGGPSEVQKFRLIDFIDLPRLEFFEAMAAAILAALPFSFAFFFHEAVDDTQVKRLLSKTRVLIVAASYFLMLSIGALVFSFIRSLYIAPYFNSGCRKACEGAMSVFLLCATLFLGFNFVHYWKTRTKENGRGPARDHEDAGQQQQEKLTITTV